MDHLKIDISVHFFREHFQRGWRSPASDKFEGVKSTHSICVLQNERFFFSERACTERETHVQNRP